MRLMVEHVLAGLVIIHVDDIRFGGKKDLGRVIAEALNDHIQTKNLQEFS